MGHVMLGWMHPAQPVPRALHPILPGGLSPRGRGILTEHIEAEWGRGSAAPCPARPAAVGAGVDAGDRGQDEGAGRSLPQPPAVLVPGVVGLFPHPRDGRAVHGGCGAFGDFWRGLNCDCDP